MYDELDQIQDLASEKLRTVQDQFGKKKIEVEREGKKIMLLEDILWKEVFYAGAESQAAQILAKKYPDVFEAYAKQNKKAEEIQLFVMHNLHMDYKQMKLSDYVKLIDAIVRLRTEQKPSDEVSA